MEQTISRALDAIAGEQRFRVLHASEAGSRAWGTPSPDSDYDIRFLYVHPLSWYLSIEEHRDLFETMLPNDLDFVGWELRKALRLFAAGNVTLFEQLRGPIYQCDPVFHERLLALVPDYFSPKRALATYLKTAEQALAQGLRGAMISIKRFFYVVRPLLACEWISAYRTMPPTALTVLLDCDTFAAPLRRETESLVSQKAAMVDNQLVPLSDAMQTWIDAAQHRATTLIGTLPVTPKHCNLEPLNTLFRDLTGIGLLEQVSSFSMR